MQKDEDSQEEAMTGIRTPIVRTLSIATGW
jgi:hypothetical protein